MSEIFHFSCGTLTLCLSLLLYSAYLYVKYIELDKKQDKSLPDICSFSGVSKMSKKVNGWLVIMHHTQVWGGGFFWGGLNAHLQHHLTIQLVNQEFGNWLTYILFGISLYDLPLYDLRLSILLSRSLCTLWLFLLSVSLFVSILFHLFRSAVLSLL